MTNPITVPAQAPAQSPAQSLDVRALVGPDRVHGSLYRDPAVFQQEIDSIWHKVWVYVGHASEVAAPGDYVRRQIGLQPVLMVRGEDDRVRVLFNRCRHRANLVCHKERGHARRLICPYHGWAYATTGELVGATFDEAYDGGLPRESFGLIPVPRVASYRGLVFASLAAEGISLEAHLGRMTEFIDLVIDRSPAGEIELSAGVQKVRYRGNWKMLPENALEGGYHGLFIHKFVFDLIDSRTTRDRNAHREDSILSLPGGHMVQDYRRQGTQKPVGAPTAAREAYLQAMERSYGKDRAQALAADLPPMFFVFPNLIYIQTHFRRVQPVSAEETTVHYHPALLKDAPPEINQELLRHHEGFYGPAGFLVPDDFQIMERNQAGLRAQGDEWLFLGRGMHREKRLEDGGSSGYAMDENHLRGMWRHYADLMSRSPT
jgi:phenylpropionate dioxygenase-like ring-hydroxylating dioxygenase large terminal subunit